MTCRLQRPSWVRLRFPPITYSSWPIRTTSSHPRTLAKSRPSRCWRSLRRPPRSTTLAESITAIRSVEVTTHVHDRRTRLGKRNVGGHGYRTPIVTSTTMAPAGTYSLSILRPNSDHLRRVRTTCWSSPTPTTSSPPATRSRSRPSDCQESIWSRRQVTISKQGLTFDFEITGATSPNSSRLKCIGHPLRLSTPITSIR